MAISVLVFVGFYLPGYKAGGPIKTVRNMTDELNAEYRFFIVTRDRDLGEKKPYAGILKSRWTKVGKTRVMYISDDFCYATSIVGIIKKTRAQFIHLNSFFSIKFGLIPLVVARIFRPDIVVIMGPRGEFSQGALGLKGLKKKFFILCFKIFRLDKGLIWHASSGFEAADVRRVIGCDAKIRVAMDIPSKNNGGDLTSKIEGEPLRVIFLSRISAKKNLLGALHVLQRVNCAVVFDVYGPIEDDFYWAECLLEAKKLPSDVVFNYAGSLIPEAVPRTMAGYHLFFLPTLGENYGHVIAEALYVGLPVLIADTTPWRGLDKKSLGWDLPLNAVDAFVRCIQKCYEKPRLEYDEWREDIRNWASKNIGGDDVLRQNKNLFIHSDEIP